MTPADKVPSHREDLVRQCCQCGKSRSELLECDVDNLMARNKRQLVKLVGEECIIKGQLGDKLIGILWDTGAQRSLIHRDTLSFLGIGRSEIKPLETVYPNLSVSSASDDKIPYYGFVEITFRLGEKEPITIPFLVSDTLSLTRPILGYNVIKHLCCLNGSGEFTQSLLPVEIVGQVTSGSKKLIIPPDVPRL